MVRGELNLQSEQLQALYEFLFLANIGRVCIETQKHAIELAQQVFELMERHVTVQQGSFKNFVSSLPMEYIK